MFLLSHPSRPTDLNLPLDPCRRSLLMSRRSSPLQFRPSMPLRLSKTRVKLSPESRPMLMRRSWTKMRAPKRFCVAMARERHCDYQSQSINAIADAHPDFYSAPTQPSGFSSCSAYVHLYSKCKRLNYAIITPKCSRSLVVNSIFPVGLSTIERRFEMTR